MDDEGRKYAVSFDSWSCNLVEKHYSNYDKECLAECLAVVWGLMHFRDYSCGQTFSIETDHQPLNWLMTTTKLTRRWALTLRVYDFEIVHRPRTRNVNANGCNKRPSPPTIHEGK